MELLPAVFETVATPSSVFDELDRAEAAGYTFVDRIDAVTSYDGGWLDVVTPTDDERRLADDVLDHALSATDAQCIAIAERRDRRLLTDDAHVGTVAQQRGVEVWDLALLLAAGIRTDAFETTEDLSTILDDLERRDNYRFGDDAVDALYDQF